MGLKIVFIGTPGFARHMLESLVASSHSVVGVVTVADKPAGRGQQLRESEVKQFAKEKQLTILQPISLKDPAFLTDLRRLNADVFVVVAFRMLPEVVWKMPRLGTLNLHASLLPNYRGAAPINWAIINGEKRSGLTTFFINEEIDCGAIIKQCTIAIQPDWTAGILHDAMLVPGAQLLIETLSSIEKNEVIPMPQPNSEALNSAPKLTKLNTKIEFDRPGNEIVQHLRTGFLVAYEDVAGYATGVLRLLDDTPLCDTLVSNGLQHVTQHYTPTVVARQTLACYQQYISTFTK